MKIQEQDRYHGPALMQIVEHESFKALNKASEKYGHYLVNTDRQIFIKYRTNDGSPWQFTMQPDELRALQEATKSNDHVFLCLVCGPVTVCGLDKDEINTVIDTKDKVQQWVSVSVPSGGSCHVTGSCGKVRHAIPHNSFPRKVFE